MQRNNRKILEVISTLKKGKFFLECPQTSEEIAIQSLDLFDNENFNEAAIELYEKQLEEIQAIKFRLQRLKLKGASKSELSANTVNIGLILERLAPTLKSFRFNKNDCRSIFDPIDYIIFEGLTQKRKVEKIFFVDIKTGNAPLQKRQKEIKELINNKNVEFKKY